jgi:hypothetical protein
VTAAYQMTDLALRAEQHQRDRIKKGLLLVGAIVVALIPYASGYWLPPSSGPEWCDSPPIELPHVDNPDMPGQIPSELVITRPASPAGFTLGFCNRNSGLPRNKEAAN